MTRNPKPRQVARTVLLVGEGDAEVQFMLHLKGLGVQRGSGIVVTIKNARGKAAAHVVDFAFRQLRNAAYDTKATLLNTDADWNDKTRAAVRLPARPRFMCCLASPALERCCRPCIAHRLKGGQRHNSSKLLQSVLVVQRQIHPYFDISAKVW